MLLLLKKLQALNMRVTPVLFAIFAMIISMGASRCAPNVLLDPSISSAEANDLTALADASDLKGCGTQLQAGLLYCRLAERTPATSKITFVGPISNCDREAACVYVKIFFPDTNPTLELKIPKDQTEVSVAWSELIKQDTFTKGQAGFWGFQRTVFYKNADGNEGKTVDEGLVYLRVLPNSYEPLHESKENPFFSFSGNHRGVIWKMTTAGRTYVERLAAAGKGLLQ